MNEHIENADRKLILASGSAYRAMQLSQLGLTFRQIPAEIDESRLDSECAEALAIRLAHEKMMAIASIEASAIVIGSDQTAVCRDRILGKPGSTERAFEQLMWCQGNRVDFHTSVAVWLPGPQKAVQHHECIRVDMRRLTESEVERYISHDQPLDCAGAFKMESLGIALFESVRSEDPTALIGLPLIGLSRLLRQAGLALP